MQRFMIALAAGMLAAVGVLRGDEQGISPNARCVAIEVVLVETAGSVEGFAADAAIPIETAASRIAELEKQGQCVSVVRIRLATLESCPASMQFGEHAPVAAARMMAPRSRDGGGGGAVTSSYTMANIGTLFRATPRVAEDGGVTLEYQMERSRLEAPPSDANREGADFVPQKIVNVTTQTTAHIPPGKMMVTEARQTTGDQSRQTWILVTAKPIDAH